jgi:hypothetical protein
MFFIIKNIVLPNIEIDKSPVWSELAANVHHSWWLTKKIKQNRNIRKSRPKNRILMSFFGEEIIENITV